LAKAASTCLQKRVFPALKGIQHLHHNRYWQYRQIISRPIPGPHGSGSHLQLS